MAKDLSIINFTNIDSEDFEGMYGGKITIFKAGVTFPFPAFLAQHFANHLADKILLKEQKDFGTEATRKPLLDKILGQIAISPAIADIKVEDLPIETAKTESEFAELLKAELPTSFVCEKCGKSFSKRIALLGHKRGCK